MVAMRPATSPCALGQITRSCIPCGSCASRPCLADWHHANDYWSFDEEACGGHPVKDLWRLNATDSGPATGPRERPVLHSSQANQSDQHSRCTFEEALLTTEVKRVINESAGQPDPFFLFWSMHLVHMPLQIPDRFLQKFAFIPDTYRRSMHAMVDYLDGEVGSVIQLLKDTKQWNNTLVVFHSVTPPTPSAPCPVDQARKGQLYLSAQLFRSLPCFYCPVQCDAYVHVATYSKFKGQRR